MARCSMRPIVIDGDAWIVRQVDPGSKSLVDRTGRQRLAVTDPQHRLILLSRNVAPPLLDKVLLHEVAHAITVSHGLLHPLRAAIPPDLWVLVEEWAVGLLENHGIEAATLASQALGRPVCIRGFCMDAS